MRLISSVVVCGCVLAFASSAAAQSKFAGKCSGSKPDPMHVIPVADRADHAMLLMKATCTWSGADLNGVALKDEVDTQVSDMIGASSKDRGYGVGNDANGDKYFVRFDGITNFKGQTPTGGTCNWAFTGGTGKLRGLKGKGTCTVTFDADGSGVVDVQGEYTIAAPKPKSH